MFWMYSRPLDTTLKWIEEQFGRNPRSPKPTSTTLKAGYNYGETTEIVRRSTTTCRRRSWSPASTATSPATRRRRSASSRRPSSPAGRCSTAATRSRPPATSCTSSPRFKHFGVKTFQAEDEIAAIGSAIGASFGGSLGMTGTSGPGIALKSEAIGLAVMVELPLVIIDVQRAGPSTGMPTKTEQADLLQCMFGRNGVAPGRHRRAVDPVRLLRHGDRGLAHRDQVPHAGDLPLRPLPRRRLRAVADPGHRRPAEDGAQLRHRPGDLPALRARPGDAGAPVGDPRHARPRAPHRRPREGRTSPATSTTTPRTTT